MNSYYGRIGGDDGGYMWLVMIGTGPKGFGTYYTNPHVKWMHDTTGDYYEAPLDMTHYDDLTEEQAKELSESWGNICFL